MELNNRGESLNQNLERKKCTRCNRMLVLEEFRMKKGGQLNKQCNKCLENAKKRCEKEGCNSQAQKDGVCKKHGATVKKCEKKGCENNARIGGLCFSHQPDDKRREQARVYHKIRYDTDPEYRIKNNVAKRLRYALKDYHIRKINKPFDLTGCSVQFLYEYIGERFTEGMNWDNYGKWHVDHIKPCSKFNLQDPEERKKCYHYTNTQPLWAKDNIRKFNTYESDEESDEE